MKYTSFRDHYLLEKKFKKMPFERLPKIGWWADQNPVTLYHGTHVRNIEWIEEHGLVPAKTGYTAGIVSLAVEPNTSWGYAAMSGAGGEQAFRDAGAKVTNTSHAERVVFVLKIPMAALKKHITDFYYKSSKEKLADKSLYDAWTKTDQEYYALTEIKWKGTIPPKYIVGYMTK